MFVRSIIIFMIFAFKFSAGQSLPGTTGYYNIPSANFYEDKTMLIGCNYLNKEYLEWNNFRQPGLAFYTTINYLPFVELSIRFSRKIDRTPEQTSVGDRMASIRVRPIEESENFPSVVIGVHSFFTTLSSGLASHFNSTYVVLSKNFEFDHCMHNLGITVGYGSDILKARNYQFIGFFGGISITPKNLRYLELMLEYDADKFNYGVRVIIKEHIVLLAGFEGMHYFSGGLCYKFLLP
jgi:hypothetical protein